MRDSDLVEFELVKNVCREALHRYDRELPTWVDYKALGADIMRWIELEITRRHRERGRSSESVPSNPVDDRRAASDSQGSALHASQGTTGQSEANEIRLQDSDGLPNWLEQSQ